MYGNPTLTIIPTEPGDVYRSPWLPTHNGTRCTAIAVLSPAQLHVYELDTSPAGPHWAWACIDPDGPDDHGRASTLPEAQQACEVAMLGLITARVRQDELDYLRDQVDRLQAALLATTRSGLVPEPQDEDPPQVPEPQVQDPAPEDPQVAHPPQDLPFEIPPTWTETPAPRGPSTPCLDAATLATIGQRIEHQRALRGLTWRDLAVEAAAEGGPSVTSRTYHYWAHGAHGPQQHGHLAQLLAWLDSAEAMEWEWLHSIAE